MRILHGDCRHLMRTLAENSVDAVVTDPPYHLTQLSRKGSPRIPGTGPFGRVHVGERGFMGKTWDGGGIAFDPAFWATVLSVLKPGGYTVAFGGPRTYHRLACAIEDAGFELKDSLMWIFGQGFPKSRNLHGEWKGWGTGLKPAYEPIVLARKPLSEPSVAANVLTWGVGALHIDACRIQGPKGNGTWGTSNKTTNPERTFNRSPDRAGYCSRQHSLGRWPANVIVDNEAAALLDAQTGVLTSGDYPVRRSAAKFKNCYGTFQGRTECESLRGANAGGASRFFYVAKASRSERNQGLEGFEDRPIQWSSGPKNPGSFQAPGTKKAAPNNHATVKPVALMRWLVRVMGSSSVWLRRGLGVP